MPKEISKWRGEMACLSICFFRNGPTLSGSLTLEADESKDD